MDRKWGFETAAKFSEAAIQRIEQYSKGRPGLIDALYELAVTLPETRLMGQLSDDAVVEAAERLGLDEADGIAVPHETDDEHDSRRSVAAGLGLPIGAKDGARVSREDETNNDRGSKRNVARWLVGDRRGSRCVFRPDADPDLGRLVRRAVADRRRSVDL